MAIIVSGEVVAKLANCSRSSRNNRMWALILSLIFSPPPIKVYLLPLAGVGGGGMM